MIVNNNSSSFFHFHSILGISHFLLSPVKVGGGVLRVNLYNISHDRCDPLIGRFFYQKNGMNTGYAAGMRDHRVKIFNKVAATSFGDTTSYQCAGIVWASVTWSKGVKSLREEV